MIELTTIDEKSIRKIIGEYYGVSDANVTLHTDYRFVRRGDDKVREDFIYGIVQTDGQPAAEPKQKSGKWFREIAFYDEEGCPCFVSRCSECGKVNPETNYCPNCGSYNGG